MIFYGLLILALIQGIFSGAVSSVRASSYSCADSPVTFEWEESENIECACVAAKSSIAFLKSIGLETTEPVRVKLVKQIPSDPDNNVIGLYNPINSHETILRTYSSVLEASQAHKPQLNIAMSENLWCGYLAHELAHVISSRYLSSKVNNRMASEYISAVTQLTVLASETREKFLQKYGEVDAYKSMAEMSELYYLFDPNKFAVKCYLHFISLDNPKEFIDLLLKEMNGH